MQPKRTRNSKPKLFQCQGYGDCSMVFTRSEHLARHARKHTGEKPFICVVPECNKAFSRFDNMMQHTQTHRNNASYTSIISHKRDTRSTTKQQTKHNITTTTTSPISLSPSNKNLSVCSSSSSSEEEDDDCYQQYTTKRRLSIADLCNPLQTENKVYQLTKDEFEALEGFSRFRHTSSSVFFNSLKDLASSSPAHVEH